MRGPAVALKRRTGLMIGAQFLSLVVLRDDQELINGLIHTAVVSAQYGLNNWTFQLREHLLKVGQSFRHVQMFNNGDFTRRGVNVHVHELGHCDDKGLNTSSK
uniref:Uncharacterized protein n=1 Tax=Cacopsylla melanoneura TaxID=428564 RepID=A0A8D8T1T2_9HEMI